MAAAAKTVAVTGASGYIGARLLRELEKRNRGPMVAVDTRPLALPVHNIVARRRDVRDPIDDILRQNEVTTLVHLASAPDSSGGPGAGEAPDNDNVLMLEAVLESCGRARVRNVVFVSSHYVYGVWPDNPVPLTEESPLRPNRDYPPSRDKFLCESLAQRFALGHPEVRLTVLRTPPVLGPGSPPDLSRIFPAARRRKAGHGDVPFQFLHEDDLARAITRVIDRETPGVFNLAAEGIATYREIAEALPQIAGRGPRIPVLPAVKLPGLPGWERAGRSGQPDVLGNPVLLGTGKVKHVLGYRTRYTSLETLTSFVNAALR